MKFNFNRKNADNNSEQQNLTQEELLKVNKTLAENLMKKADTSEKSKFEILTNVNQFLAARDLSHATAKIAKSFKKTADNMYRQYITQLKLGVDELGLLIEYRKMKKYEAFYQREANVMSDAAFEYRCYLWSGHRRFIDACMGKERLAEDQYDFSGLNLAEKYNN